MKKIVVALALFMISIVGNSQVRTPQASPKTLLNQLVGLTDVEIEYSRPSARGRIVFGELVPFGRLWRTGANANTTISFSEDVVIDGKTLKKGKYALYTLPRIDTWEIVFYTKTDNWGNPDTFSEENVSLRAIVKPELTARNVETFTIDINNLDNNFGVLNLMWERTLVALKFEVPTQKIAIQSIEKALAGPTAGDYYSSAQYFYQSNGDLTKALTYINKALELNVDKPFYYSRLKSLIQAKLGDKKAALETAKQSLAAAILAKNNDYIKMNQDSILEWSKK